MKKSQWRVRPGVILGLVPLFFCMLIFLLPSNGTLWKKPFMAAHFQEVYIADGLKQYVAERGTLSNLNNSLVFYYLLKTDDRHLHHYSYQTNEQGGILDPWKTQYQIEVIPPTNFVIRSAGSNQKFDDADDITFNSISNGFVKP